MPSSAAPSQPRSCTSGAQPWWGARRTGSASSARSSCACAPAAHTHGRRGFERAAPTWAHGERLTGAGRARWGGSHLGHQHVAHVHRSERAAAAQLGGGERRVDRRVELGERRSGGRVCQTELGSKTGNFFETARRELVQFWPGQLGGWLQVEPNCLLIEHEICTQPKLVMDSATVLYKLYGSFISIPVSKCMHAGGGPYSRGSSTY